MAQISIVLITYNRSKLLPKMISAIKAQSYVDYEVILINNGSTDETASICEEYAKIDSRVKLITIKENNGAAPARNIGLSHITGKYAIMVDDDDYCHPNMLEHLYNMAEKYQADIAVTGCVDEYSNGQIVPRYVYDELYVLNGYEGISEFLKREKFHTAPATKLFKSSLFEGKQWTVGTRVDDIHFIYKLFVDAKVVVAQGKPMYHFYKHGSNMTGFLSGDILKPDVLDDYLAMQDERVEYISKYAPSVTEQVKYARVSYMISMVEKIENGQAVGCERQLEYMKKYIREHRDDLLGREWTTEREKRLVKEYIDVEH